MNHEGAEEEPQVHGAESGNGKPFFFFFFCQNPPSWLPALSKPGWRMLLLAIKFSSCILFPLSNLQSWTESSVAFICQVFSDGQ